MIAKKSVRREVAGARYSGGCLPRSPARIPAMPSHATALLRRLRNLAACLVLFLMVARLGAGVSFLRAPGEEPPSGTAPAAPPRAKAEPQRDRSGDLLPPGAVARLGTLRFRAPEEITTLAFAPDGKTIAVSTRA